MDNKLLVELVTREVMKRISQLEKENKKEKVLIISSNNAQVDKLKSKLGSDYEIQVSNHQWDGIKGYDHIIMGEIQEQEQHSLFEGNKRVIEEKVIINERLITEQKLRKNYINGVRTITIGKNSILTPLAADFIREHNMVINKGEL